MSFAPTPDLIPNFISPPVFECLSAHLWFDHVCHLAHNVLEQHRLLRHALHAVKLLLVEVPHLHRPDAPILVEVDAAEPAARRYEMDGRHVQEEGRGGDGWSDETEREGDYGALMCD